ncbi:MAG: ABC transporter permease, partial [Myxococcota bacterium]
MSGYILRRTLWAFFVVVAVFALVFVLVFVQGDPAVTTLGPRATPDQIADFEERQGLDQPLWKQFGSSLGVLPCARPASPNSDGYCGLLQGDLGESFRSGESVSAIVAQRLPRTLLLGAMALLIQLLIGLSFGIFAAL